MFRTLLTLIICIGFLLPQGKRESELEKIHNTIKENRNKNPYQSIEIGKRAIAEGLVQQDSLIYARILDEIGVCYKKTGNLDSALTYHNKALSLFTKINDRMGEAFVYSNLGNLFRMTNEFNLALDYFKKSLKIKEMLGDQGQIAYTFNSIGLLYNDMKNYPKAYEAFNTALMIEMKLNREDQIANIYSNLGILEKFFKNYTKAVYFTEKALTYYEKNNMHYGCGVTYLSLGEISVRINNYNAAVDYYKKALKRADILNSDILKRDIYLAFSDLYNLMGDFKNAYVSYQNYAKARENIQTGNIENRIAELRVFYETEKKETENKSLKLSNLAQQKELEKQNVIRNYLALTLVLSVIIVIVIYLSYKTKKKAHQTILTQKEKVEILNESLFEANATKDKFFSIIAHDLRNPFSAVMNYSELFHYDFDSLTDEEKKDFANRIYNSTSKINKLLENLLDWSRSQRDKINIRMQELYLKNLIEDAIGTLSETAHKKEIKFEIDVDESLVLMSDEYMLKTIIQNITFNAIKYSYRGGEIKITGSQNLDHYTISIRDYGVGMDEYKASNLFKIDKNISLRGTENEDGTGLGLILCREFINKLNGKIIVKSELEKGSEFNIILQKT